MKIPGKILLIQIYSCTRKTGQVIPFSGKGRELRTIGNDMKLGHLMRGVNVIKHWSSFGSNLADFYSCFEFSWNANWKALTGKIIIFAILFSFILIIMVF